MSFFFFFFTFFWQLHKQAVLKYKYMLHYSSFKGESNGNRGMQRAWCEWCGASFSPAWMQQECHTGLWDLLRKPISGQQDDEM